MTARRGIGRPRIHGPGTGAPAGTIELPDGLRVTVTVHCVDRFWERGASGCVRFADALARLQILAGRIGERVERPEWVGSQGEADDWIALGPDLVLAVKDGVAVTCLARGSVSDAARASRNHRRRRRPPRDGRRRDPRPPDSDASGRALAMRPSCGGSTRMPNETWYQLVIEGPPPDVAKFRADATLWQVEPWSSLYSAQEHVHDPVAGRLVYQYADDYKRPGPSVAAMAARHPALIVICETCDELGLVASRARYAGGIRTEVSDVDPSELDWIVWEESYGEE